MAYGSPPGRNKVTHTVRALRLPILFSVSIAFLALEIAFLSTQVKLNQYVSRADPGWYLSNIKMMGSNSDVSVRGYVPAPAICTFVDLPQLVAEITPLTPAVALIFTESPVPTHLRSPPVRS